MLSEGNNLPAISHGVNVRIIARFHDAKTCLLMGGTTNYNDKDCAFLFSRQHVGNDIHLSAIIVD